MRLTILIFAFLYSGTILSQSAWYEYRAATDHYYQGNYDNAMEIFQELVSTKKDSIVYYFAYFKVGEVYLKKKEFDKSERILWEFINNSSFNKVYEFRYDAYRALARIYYEKNYYQKALDYLTIADTSFSLNYSCGNASAGAYLEEIEFYSDCFLGLGKKEKALKTLLPHIFNNGLASNHRIVKKTLIILKDMYSNEELIQIFHETEKNIKLKENDPLWGNDMKGYIVLFDIEITFPSSININSNGRITKTKEEWTKKYLNEFKESDIYKLVMNL